MYHVEKKDFIGPGTWLCPPKGRFEQLPLDRLGGVQNVLSADWLSSMESLPPFLFMKLRLLNLGQRGQVEWMFAFGLGSDLACWQSKAVFVDFLFTINKTIINSD